jgi:polysaccharide pyruvyl transferase WcaK-like protein
LFEKTPIKILVAEFFPSLNKGELAILGGLIKSLELIGRVETAVFSFDFQIDKLRYPNNVKLIDMGDNLYSRNFLEKTSKTYHFGFSFFAAFQHFLFILFHSILGKNALRIMDKPLWKIYSEYDAFIICTDEVDCVNGSKLQLSPLYISLLAKALKKPIIFYANGTTPATSELWIWRFHTRKLWRILAKYILSMVDLITVREEGTFQYFTEITNGKVPIYLTADLAFLLSPVSKKKVEKIMLDERIAASEAPLIGVAMSRHILTKAYVSRGKPETKYSKAIKEIAQSLDKIVEEFHSTIVFIPHGIEPYDSRDDRIVARDIYDLMLNKHNVQLINKEYSAEELKGLIGRLDVLLSCRCHAAISALSMDIPTIVLTHSLDRRVYNIIGKMAKQEKWIYNVENLSAAELFTLVSNLIMASNEIRKVLPSIMDSIKERALLNGKLLKALLESRPRVIAELTK